MISHDYHRFLKVRKVTFTFFFLLNLNAPQLKIREGKWEHLAKTCYTSETEKAPRLSSPRKGGRRRPNFQSVKIKVTDDGTSYSRSMKESKRTLMLHVGKHLLYPRPLDQRMGQQVTWLESFSCFLKLRQILSCLWDFEFHFTRCTRKKLKNSRGLFESFPSKK